MQQLNSVTLLDWGGGDKSHCLQAWQSTALELDVVLPTGRKIAELFEATENTKQKSAEELLSYLWSHNHQTPFEASYLHFQVRADIATHIHFLKHRIGVSTNSESCRYREVSDKWYIPKDWESGAWAAKLEAYTSLGHRLYHEACEELTPVLGRKRAKETARYFLPYNKQLDFGVVMNFRSFVHFYNLRASDHAQKEVADLAKQMLSAIIGIKDNSFVLSLKAAGLL